MITATLTRSAAPAAVEMTPLGVPPVTITVTAQPANQPEHNTPLHDMSFLASGLNSEPIQVPADYRGKLVVVHFWASWCPACTREEPNWVAAYQAYKNRGVAFVGIPVDRNRALSLEGVRSKTARSGMAWPQVYADAPTLSLKFHIKSLPAVFVVEGDTGRVLAQGNSVRGANLARELEAQVSRLRPTAPEPLKLPVMPLIELPAKKPPQAPIH